MPVGDFPKGRERYAALSSHLRPPGLAVGEARPEVGKHCVHFTDYPDTDTARQAPCYPQVDRRTRDNWGMGITKIREVLARNVAARMEKTGLDTQPKLAAKSHVSQSHISRLLNKESGVSIDVLEGLAEAFDCQPWELLVDDEATREQAVRRFLR